MKEEPKTERTQLVYPWCVLWTDILQNGTSWLPSDDEIKDLVRKGLERDGYIQDSPITIERDEQPTLSYPDRIFIIAYCWVKGKIGTWDE